MKKTIANNDHYSIEIDRTKNRLYFTPQGFWEDVAAVPNISSDMDKAARELSKGFTLLSNLVNFKTPPQEVLARLGEIQKSLARSGCTRIATVVGQNVLVDMASQRHSKAAGITSKSFSGQAKAERWLQFDSVIERPRDSKISERISEIEYKGKTILYCNLSNAQESEIKAATDEVDRRVIEKGTRDQLFLVNVQNCTIDREALQAFKESARRIEPYLKGSASFGVTGMKLVFMNAINRFSGMSVTAHPSMKEAQEYLIDQANK